MSSTVYHRIKYLYMANKQMQNGLVTFLKNEIIIFRKYLFNFFSFVPTKCIYNAIFYLRFIPVSRNSINQP